MGDPIWHGYDQAAHDDQYKASGTRIRNPEEYLARWRAESAAWRASCDGLLDVPFGPSRDETYDVFLSPARRAPVHIFIHGGYWYSMTSKEFSFVAKGLVPAGFIAVVLNYALCPTVSMTELVRQVRAGIAHVHANAHTWGGDPDRVTISGHSAGGHLVASAMTTDWPSFAPGRPPDMIKAGMALSGLYELEPIRLCYVNAHLRMDEAEAAALSPAQHLQHARGALTVAVGGRESEQFHWHQEHFCAAWGERTGATPRVIDLPGHHHFSLLDELSDPQGVLAREVQRQAGL
ncbi:MAG: alpha/beta hydrolase [Rhodoferax sp.]|nr:alpha/beta hydrolase [Rhodoferax sp.]